MTTQELVERLAALTSRLEPWSHTKAVAAMEDAASRLSEMEGENKRLREALERVLLDVEFMWDDGTLPNRRDDVIYVRARAALEHQP